MKTPGLPKPGLWLSHLLLIFSRTIEHSNRLVSCIVVCKAKFKKKISVFRVTALKILCMVCAHIFLIIIFSGKNIIYAF